MSIRIYILRGRWSPIIIWRARLLNQRITDLKKDIVDCNERMIIKHINDLLEYNILAKTEYDTYPKHTEYNLIEFGWKLILILAKMQESGIEYLQNNQLLTKND